MPTPLHRGLRKHFSPAQMERLAIAKVAIAGAGGLGSNVALMLARSGIENFVLIDCDQIEPSNLNRQHYWPAQIGLPKVEALAEHLRALNPLVKLDCRQLRLNARNLPALLPLAEIWVEALDDAAIKKTLAELALLAGKQVVAASGIAGYGGKPMRSRRMGNMLVVGDFETDIKTAAPLAPRVCQAAALLADGVLQFILD